MPLGEYNEQRGGRRRWGPSIVSLAIHGAAFVAFTHAPGIQLPHATESEYRQKIAGKEDKLVWYKFRELPHVTPPRAKTSRERLRAAVVAKQSIVSSPKDAPRRNQMVWTPAPQPAPAPPLDSPNLLAIKLPDPPAKAFVTPPDLPRKDVKIDVPDAPEMKPQTPDAAQLRPVRLPPRPFEAPPVVQPKIAQIKPMDDAPQLAAKAIPASGEVNGPSVKLPPKPFIAPSRGASAPARNVEVADLSAVSNTADSPLNVAIVGLNPLDRPAPLPSAPSPAAFSAGPKVRAEGAVSEGARQGLSVPDLFVRGTRDAKPDPIGSARSAGQALVHQAYAAPTSSETLRAAMRQGEPVMMARVDPAPAPEKLAGAAKVSSAPDPRFNGRDVYMMAIQMPNLTSFSGSWLMWYAARTQREAGLAPIAPPVVHRKVDPKYLPSAVAERVEGKVRLFCVIDEEGKVSHVEVVRGADDRLNQAAEEAMAKWEFYPATRHGEPVEVDVLVEIPFTLAPPIPYRR